MLRLAAAAGCQEAVALLLAEFGGQQGGAGAEACLRAVLRGAVHAGQVALLQALDQARESGSSAALHQHLAQPDSLAEYLRAALLCGQVDTAAWLLGLAARQQQQQRQQPDVVAATLASLLTTSRRQLWGTGVGRTARDAAAALLKALAAVTPAAAAAPAAAHSSAGADDTLDAAAFAAPTPAAATMRHAGCSGQVLNAQVVNLLLQAAAGDPVMLFSVVDLVHSSWGSGRQQQQQQVLGCVPANQAPHPGMAAATASTETASTHAATLRVVVGSPDGAAPAGPSICGSGSGSSHTTVASTSTSSSTSFNALHVNRRRCAASTPAALRDAWCACGGSDSSKTPAGSLQPAAGAGSWPAVLSCKSDGGISVCGQHKQRGNGWNDQRPWPEADAVVDVDAGAVSGSSNSSSTREEEFEGQQLITRAQ
ncbi:hypothetical protein COO60DRAFT_862686 [Scenedesmus sp. NREL 46B-D3]|nr:hypothetical protein COO60DRAFT_862686 [Scenedesmus sp. NREL 46B-D3]